MKSTSLVLDEHLLEEARRLGGERTYSKTVARALEEFVRRIKARKILDLGGSGLWSGALGAFRTSPVERQVRFHPSNAAGTGHDPGPVRDPLLSRGGRNGGGSARTTSSLRLTIARSDR